MDLNLNNGLRVAFPTDEHRPFHNPAAVELAMKIVRDFDPHVRIAGSDGVDFYSISRFEKDPMRVKQINLQDEINSWKAGQREWRDAAPNARGLWIQGNHEERLRKFLARKAEELMYLEAMTIEKILGLDELELENSTSEVNLGKLVIKHGSVVRKHSAYSALAELEKEFFSISTMTGHTHRGGVSYASNRNGLVAAYEGFCLCRLDPPYVERPNWQNGILLATVYPDQVNVEPVPFFPIRDELTAVWRDKHYRTKISASAE